MPGGARGDVLDDAIAIDQIELAGGERQALRGVGLHEWAGVAGLGHYVYAGHIHLWLKRSQSQLATAYVQHFRALRDARHCEEALVSAPACARCQRGGEPRERAAGGGIDVWALFRHALRRLRIGPQP